MKKTNNWILRIVVNFDAFNEWTVGEEFGGIEHQTQQFGGKKRKKHVCGRWGNGNSDAVLQRLYVKWQCEDHPLVFATKNGRIGGVLFVIGVTGGGKVGSDGKRRKIYKIIINVASRR